MRRPDVELQPVVRDHVAITLTPEGSCVDALMRDVKAVVAGAAEASPGLFAQVNIQCQSEEMFCTAYTIDLSGYTEAELTEIDRQLDEDSLTPEVPQSWLDPTATALVEQVGDRVISHISLILPAGSGVGIVVVDPAGDAASIVLTPTLAGPVGHLHHHLPSAEEAKFPREFAISLARHAWGNAWSPLSPSED